MLGGVARNFQVFEPLDFLAELTQHIPNKGEHLIRYYGHYSNKARGCRVRKRIEGMKIEGLSSNPSSDSESVPDLQPGPLAEYHRRERRRWAMLIKRVYQTDPLMCPRCGGVMKIIAFIEARQGEIVRKILEHCGLWEAPVRGPPVLPFITNPAQADDPDSRRTYQLDPDFLECTRREQSEEAAGQLALPWDD
jgi:hypothetical protein